MIVVHAALLTDLDSADRRRAGPGGSVAGALLFADLADPVIEFDVLRFYKCILIDRKLGNIIPSLLLQIFFQKSKYHIPVRLEHAPPGSKQFMLCARYFYHFCHAGTAFCHFPDHPLLGTVGYEVIILRLK